jgi:Spy/CpxP family protein refolding chaperone
MKRCSGWLGAMVLLALASGTLGQAAGGGAGVRGNTAAPAGARGGAAGSALNLAFYADEFNIMTQQLTLTDDQKARLQDRITTMNREIDTFLSNVPSQIAAGRRGARSGVATGRGGSGGAPLLNPAVVKLQDDLQLLINEHQVLIDQALTPEQRLAWEGYKLHRVLDPRLRSLALTDDQQDKIKALFDAAAKSLAELKDGKMVPTLQGQFFRKIISDVLTDTQVAKFMQGALQVQGSAARGAATAPARGPATRAFDVEIP